MSEKNINSRIHNESQPCWRKAESGPQMIDTEEFHLMETIFSGVRM